MKSFSILFVVIATLLAILQFGGEAQAISPVDTVIGLVPLPGLLPGLLPGSVLPPTPINEIYVPGANGPVAIDASQTDGIKVLSDGQGTLNILN